MSMYTLVLLLREGVGSRAPPNDCLCLPFRFAQNTFSEHHVTTRQQAIMEKGVTMFKDNILVRSFLDFLQNCWPPTGVHKFDPIIRLINTPLRMCRRIEIYAYRIVIGTLLVIMT